MTVRRAARTLDPTSVERLLEAAGLPLDGAVAAVEQGAVLREGEAIVACAGLESHGEAWLLRSVAVASDRRGQGFGRRVVRAAEQAATASGARELYLLTETAGPFFARLGYEPVDRAAVPPALAASAEFADLCPVAAPVMWRRLG
ncbi:MAG: arsenic resistance N-acetyltransferase ArsN2 [Candidatus Limnocylindrales bacterium]